MPTRDTDRYTYGSRRIGRVGSGHDEADHEAVEGMESDEVIELRQTLVGNAPPDATAAAKSRFAQALERRQANKKK